MRIRPIANGADWIALGYGGYTRLPADVGKDIFARAKTVLQSFTDISYVQRVFRT